tara:strand:+ start:30 stop:323 length:294 start_codon:yes stop_codon:yes gene_type:complete
MKILRKKTKKVLDVAYTLCYNMVMLDSTTHTIDCSSSTAVDSATYDSATEHLTIAFEHGTYRYGNVDQAMYEAFEAIESKGKGAEVIKTSAGSCIKM